MTDDSNTVCVFWGTFWVEGEITRGYISDDGVGQAKGRPQWEKTSLLFKFI